MSRVRVSVGWIFGDMINYFKFLDFKKNLKVQIVLLEKCTLSVLYFIMLGVVYMGQKNQDFSKLNPHLLKSTLYKTILITMYGEPNIVRTCKFTRLCRGKSCCKGFLQKVNVILLNYNTDKNTNNRFKLLTLVAVKVYMKFCINSQPKVDQSFA